LTTARRVNTGLYHFVRLGNGVNTGLKILGPPSYHLLPDDTTQDLSTFQPSKQAEVVPGITR